MHDTKQSVEKGLERKVQLLIHSIDRIQPSTGRLLLRSFLHGIFTALGATIGLSIALALITFVLAQLQLIPGLDELIRQSQIEQIFPTP